MNQTYRVAGFFISGALHLGVAAALLPYLYDAAPAGSPETLPLNLAMFDTLSPPEPSPVTPAPAPMTTPAPPRLPTQKPPRPRPKATAAARPAKRKPEPRQQPSRPPPPASQAIVVTSTTPPSAVTTPPADDNHGETSALVVVSAANHAIADTQIDTVRQRYRRALTKRIRAKRFYPAKARRRRQEGEVRIAFVIHRSGVISDIRVSRSSGSVALDQAAVKTLRRISPFQPLPNELNLDRWEFSVPIAYSLRG